MKLVETNIANNESFYAGDSESLYLKNLQEMPPTWIWRNKKVKYSINSQGYRSPEWNTIDWSQSTLLFGCSFTFGVGISDEDTCGKQLESIIGSPVVNLGVSGGSPMLQWVNSSILVHNCVAPKAVVYIWPPAHRVVELLPTQRAVHHGPWSDADWGRYWITHDTHSLEYLRYLVWTTTAMWKCPVVHYHIDYDTCNQITELEPLGLGPNDYARDWNNGIAHPGPEANRYWAEKIANKLHGLW